MKMLMSLDVATLPSPLTLPLPLSPNVYPNHLLSFVLIELNILASSIMCCVQMSSSGFIIDLQKKINTF
jgi:hypothetical protein